METTHTNIPLAILIAGLFVSGSIIYVGKGSPASIFTGDTIVATPGQVKSAESLVTAGDPVLGNPKAKVTIVEFSDFQCPFCRSFWNDAYQQIKKEYIDTGKARLVFRDFPLPFHPAAKPAALAAQCANDQGKFWQYHDKIFSEQNKIGQGTVTFGNPDLKAWASEIGLNADKFNSCLDSNKHEDGVAADMSAGSNAGVDGTPSFFINGRLVVGAQPFASFKSAIDLGLE